MIRLNENYLKLQGSYLFAEIAKRVKAYGQTHPDKKIIRLGIGDVTRPLAPAVIDGLKQAVEEMSDIRTFKGYGPDGGYDFLRDIIRDSDFRARGISIDSDEIIISTGAKEDSGNFQELFAGDTTIAVPDPVYTVYVESNVMAGRSGEYNDGQYEKFVYLPATIENNFVPGLPSRPVDLIYLCFPNNPTGQVLTKDQLQKWVEYAHANQALILFDAAYEAFIRDDNIPHSIFEIEGADEVAVEFRSLSKTAGFTGTRCSYTIIPKKVMVYDREGNKHSLNALWNRRQSTKFNNTSYIIQKGAYQAFTPEGRRQTQEQVDYYLENARIIREGIASLGVDYTGGTNSPYVWFRAPKGLSSWDWFDLLLNRCQVVGTPGSGFGKCGQGFFRLSAFGDREEVKEAINRIRNLDI